MPDYRSMFSKPYVGAWDLEGKEVTVTITEVKAGSLVMNGKTDKKPIVHFKESDKGLVCNATNGKTIAGLYGTKTEAWIGKKITLYASTTSVGGETKDCVRVRNVVPEAAE
jgi:hypothetical protein